MVALLRVMISVSSSSSRASLTTAAEMVSSVSPAEKVSVPENNE